MEHSIVIDEDGAITMIYDDRFRELLDLGKATITRVSNVEPNPNGNWIAHMNDGTLLGPFKFRQEALDAELDYLKEKLFNG